MHTFNSVEPNWQPAADMTHRHEFLWGVSTSAFQIEGAIDADGRGQSIWDGFTKQPGTIANGDTADLACDHYHRYGEDLDLARALGSGLIDQSQKMTVAAIAMAEKKVWAHRS